MPIVEEGRADSLAQEQLGPSALAPQPGWLHGTAAAPSLRTRHQLLNVDSSLQLDPLQFILQDQLVRLVDVLGAGRLRQQVVLWRQARPSARSSTIA